MIKADESAMPGSTWSKAGDTEPVFILRAQDVIAPVVIRIWASIARLLGTPQHKIYGALNLAVEMERWGKDRAKTPD